MIFKPAKQRSTIPETIGFDIETHNRNLDFTCASLVSDTWTKNFYDKQELIDAFKHSSLRGKTIVATNLSFDFFGTFDETPEIQDIQLLFKDSDLLYAKTYIYDGKLNPRPKGKEQPLLFLDTFNYAKISVEKMGNILGLPKAEKPVFLGREPENEQEWRTLMNYNVRDSQISKAYIDFLFKAFYDLGANPKNTLASTAMSLYKNRYMQGIYYIQPTPVLKNLFKAYYGGRTEAYSRGPITNYNYADFNSLYPSCMLGEYPDPNTLRRNESNTTEYIENFEGVACVDIHVPYMYYPPLPVRTKEKLIFPHGLIKKKWYPNVELRKAIDLGCEIKRVYNNYYYTDTMFPFKEYVLDLYSLRQKYKKEGSPMEYVVKILMNSLYGKFGQRFTDRDNYIPIEQLDDYLIKGEIDDWDIVQDYARIKVEETRPAPFCKPIWALYTTAYARIKMLDALYRYKGIYGDTDSILTKRSIEDSKVLGELKLECRATEGMIIRPKMYCYMDQDATRHVRVKGMARRLKYDELLMMASDNASAMCYFEKFVKFKEAKRRKLKPGEIIAVKKRFGLEDDKRVWPSAFNAGQFQSSEPIKI